MTNKEAINLKAGDKIVCIQDHLIKRRRNKQIFTPGKYYTINNVIEYMESDKDEYNELYPLTEIFVTDDYGVIRSTNAKSVGTYEYNHWKCHCHLFMILAVSFSQLNLGI